MFTMAPLVLFLLVLHTTVCQQTQGQSQSHGFQDDTGGISQPWSPMPNNSPTFQQPADQSNQFGGGTVGTPIIQPDIEPEPEWTHSAALDVDGRVVLSWTPDPNGAEIMFQVAAKTKGYIGIGFSPTGLMPMSDVVVGWVSNGSPTLQDRYAEGHIEPTMDIQQDYRLLGGHENETHTILRFSRKYDTCDERDMIITNDTMYVIFALHDDDPQGTVLAKHTFEGTKRLYLGGFDKLYNANNNNSPDVGSWELRMPNISLPKSQSTTACMKAMVSVPPPPSGKAEIVGFEPLFTNGHSNHVTHMWLYECDNTDSTQRTTDTKSYECDSRESLGNNCTNVLFAWGTGSKGNTLPASTSYTIPGTGANFILEVRYDDLDKFDGNFDDSGLKLFYDGGSRGGRREEIATMIIGHVWGSSQVVPPEQRAFVSVGICDGECTKQYLNQDGIYISSVFLQGGNLAEQMKLRHIRQDMELAPIATDYRYNASGQTQRVLLDPIHVLPGDQLILECTYNTQDIHTTTLGGSGSENSACLAQLQYFPKSDLRACVSSPPLDQLFEILKARQNMPRVPTSYDELVPNSGDPKAAEYLKSYNWSGSSGDFQTFVRTGSYTPICGRSSTSVFGYHVNATMSESKQPPKVSNPYYEHSSCGSGNITGPGMQGGVIFPSDSQPPWGNDHAQGGHAHPHGEHDHGGHDHGGHDVMPNDFPGHPFGDIPAGTDMNISSFDNGQSTTQASSSSESHTGTGAHKSQSKDSADKIIGSTWLTAIVVAVFALRRL